MKKSGKFAVALLTASMCASFVCGQEYNNFKRFNGKIPETSVLRFYDISYENDSYEDFNYKKDFNNDNLSVEKLCEKGDLAVNLYYERKSENRDFESNQVNAYIEVVKGKNKGAFFFVPSVDKYKVSKGFIKSATIEAKKGCSAIHVKYETNPGDGVFDSRTEKTAIFEVLTKSGRIEYIGSYINEHRTEDSSSSSEITSIDSRNYCVCRISKMMGPISYELQVFDLTKLENRIVLATDYKFGGDFIYTVISDEAKLYETNDNKNFTVKSDLASGDSVKMLFNESIQPVAYKNMGVVGFMIPVYTEDSETLEGYVWLYDIVDNTDRKSALMGRTKKMIASENLRLREGEETSSNVLTTMSAGTKVEIVEVGKKDNIDGNESHWVKVEVKSGAKDSEGKDIKAGLQGWCYGGYLK
ncbi:SH3 domain-containing protein [Treponema sp.]|uniref:SH3 domain-containing protein n=1 Tax=Treponema sp. TaxID=166 RepID=UPI0025EE9882|nr:SH3 domain-containing protein [Treponema sp.]